MEPLSTRSSWNETLQDSGYRRRQEDRSKCPLKFLCPVAKYEETCWPLYAKHRKHICLITSPCFDGKIRENVDGPCQNFLRHFVVAAFPRGGMVAFDGCNLQISHFVDPRYVEIRMGVQKV